MIRKKLCYFNEILANDYSGYIDKRWLVVWWYYVSKGYAVNIYDSQFEKATFSLSQSWLNLKSFIFEIIIFSKVINLIINTSNKWVICIE